MKRTRLKTGSRQLKRTPLKRGSTMPKIRAKKPSVTTLKKKLWDLVKQFIRSRDGDTCYTCDAKELIGSNRHTSHFIPSAACGALLRFHPQNLAVCCYNCNINLGGNGSEFYRRLVQDKGQIYVDNLFTLKEKTIKADVIFYDKLIDLYTEGNEDSITSFLNTCIHK